MKEKEFEALCVSEIKVVCTKSLGCCFGGTRDIRFIHKRRIQSVMEGKTFLAPYDKNLRNKVNLLVYVERGVVEEKNLHNFVFSRVKEREIGKK